MIHIANGDCTTAIIRQAGIEGDLLIWADVLYEGPVPAGLTERELRETRARFLSDDEPRRYERIFSDLERSAAIVDGRSPDEELVLWFEHDLFDQLNLIHLLDRIAASRAGVSHVSLICIDRFPGRPAFKGLGQLTPDELLSLVNEKQPVTHRQCDVARRAWLAFRAADPRALEGVISGDLSPLPFLGAALRRYLEEFPSVVNGLSRSELHLLGLIKDSPVDTWTAFERMQEGETSFYITDGSLWSLILGLTPLVAIEGDVSTSNPLPSTTIAITTAGREALEGRLDRVRIYGLDRWMGGVHLEGTEAAWRWNPTSGRVEPYNHPSL